MISETDVERKMYEKPKIQNSDLFVFRLQWSVLSVRVPE